MGLKKKNKYLLYSIILIACCFVKLHSQDNAFYSWNGLAVKKDIKKFTLYLQEEVRFRNTLRVYNEYFTQFGLRYKPAGWVALSQYYRYTFANSTEYTKRITQSYSDVVFSLNKYRTKFSARLRYQINQSRNNEYRLFEHRSRNKIQISRDIYKSPLSPFIGYESFTRVYPVYKPEVFKNRFIIGSNVYLKSNLDFSFSYFMDFTTENGAPIINHIFAARLTYEL